MVSGLALPPKLWTLGNGDRQGFWPLTACPISRPKSCPSPETQVDKVEQFVAVPSRKSVRIFWFFASAAADDGPYQARLTLSPSRLSSAREIFGSGPSQDFTLNITRTAPWRGISVWGSVDLMKCNWWRASFPISQQPSKWGAQASFINHSGSKYEKDENEFLIEKW